MNALRASILIGTNLDLHEERNVGCRLKMIGSQLFFRKFLMQRILTRRMELYIKAAADGVSVGDCPFAHYVR